MRFVDASVFLHAYLRPNKKPPPEIETLKRDARKIVERVAGGEPVITTLIHISEIANILEARVLLEEGLDIISGLLSQPNLEVIEPSKALYEAAVEEAREKGIGVNDALAAIIIRERGENEVYSFDTDFDKVKGLRRIAK